MPKTDTSRGPHPEYHEYVAWDVPTRLFHWINALAVLGLIATGVGILTGNLLGLSPEGKIALKSVHVVFGYVMATNLIALDQCRPGPGLLGKRDED
jgi:Ni,Fe-hydrogenase I cytochrome b subunit